MSFWPLGIEGMGGTREEGRAVRRQLLTTQARNYGNSGNEDGETWAVLREVKEINTKRFWRLSMEVGGIKNSSQISYLGK